MIVGIIGGKVGRIAGAAEAGVGVVDAAVEHGYLNALPVKPFACTAEAPM